MRVFRNLMQMRDGRKNRQLAETTENTGMLREGNAYFDAAKYVIKLKDDLRKLAIHIELTPGPFYDSSNLCVVELAEQIVSENPIFYGGSVGSCVLDSVQMKIMDYARQLALVCEISTTHPPARLFIHLARYGQVPKLNDYCREIADQLLSMADSEDSKLYE